MQFFEAKVVSVKTPQTVGVEISYFKKHAKYQKIVKLTTKLLAHNELDGVKVGDIVKIVKSRPYSKLKHFLVTEILVSSKSEQEVVVKSKKVEVQKEEVKKDKKGENKKETKSEKSKVKNTVKKLKSSKK